jgi:hypothetical protein
MNTTYRRENSRKLLSRPYTRKVTTLVWVFILTSGIALGQPARDTTVQSGSHDDRDARAQAWLDDLYTPGVTIRDDSVHFNAETRRIVSDSLYRLVIYPPTYSWPIVQALMQKKAIKPAIWYLINLYRADTANRAMVLQMILPLDEVLDMDRVLVAAYYTYIPFDPEVHTIVNGRSVAVTRPDIAEQKLLAMKAITDQVYARRKDRR